MKHELNYKQGASGHKRMRERAQADSWGSAIGHFSAGRCIGKQVHTPVFFSIILLGKTN
jgi:hypothetical protein